MNADRMSEGEQRPLAGACLHIWLNQESQYAVEQICKLCKLYRYKPSLTADWEYRAPIAFTDIRRE
jgi:hypothetical protein